MKKMLVLHQGKEKKVSILSDEFFEEQAFPYLLPTGKFGYDLTQDIPISPSQYFNQRLLNFNQYFASNGDYILFNQACTWAAPLTFINELCYTQK